MQYGRLARKAIRDLPSGISERFNALESRERGEMRAVPELCSALLEGPRFITFACLSGDGNTGKLDENLGFLSSGRKCRIISDMMAELTRLGATPSLTIVIDDFEPNRAWQWNVPQSDVSEWCELLAISTFAERIQALSANVVLSSQLEHGIRPGYEEAYQRAQQPGLELLIHANERHMKRFPNKKRIGGDRESAVRKVAQYAVQGLALERAYPDAILLQTETPWGVKDPLYDTWRQSPLPIVHLFEDERR